MFGLRLSRPFQSLCSSQNARSFHAFSSLRPIATHTPAFKPGSGCVYNSFRNTTVRNALNFTSNANAGKTGPKISGLKSFGFGFGTITMTGLGLGFAAYQIQKPPVLCEGKSPSASPATAPPRSESMPTPMQPDDDALLPPPPRSSLNMLELGFGTVAGICAGVFIKKGAKALAFVLGGVFVLLQYFASIRLVRIDWTHAESRFQDAFYSRSSKDATGKEISRPPTVYSLFHWIIDFLTADFPPRATFIAGMALGLRLG